MVFSELRGFARFNPCLFFKRKNLFMLLKIKPVSQCRKQILALLNFAMLI